MNPVEAVAREPVPLFLAGLGITFAPYEYFGGIFLALAGASIAAILNKQEDKKSFWASMLIAIFVSHVSAIVAKVYFDGINLQIVMAISGLGSAYIVNIVLMVFSIFEKRSDVIADKLIDRVLPDDKN